MIADFDRDKCLDLLIGAPAADDNRGRVYLIRGAELGSATRHDLVLPYTGRAGDRFGSALAVERVMSGLDDGPSVPRRIWVGAPGADVKGARHAGAIAFYTVDRDLKITGPVRIDQNSPGIPGVAEPNDRFGEVLAPVGNVRVMMTGEQFGPLGSGVAVGVPGEDLGSRTDAGMVVVVPEPGTPRSKLRPHGLTQDSPHVPGRAEAGDRFGAAVDLDKARVGPSDPPILWVGAPGEDLGHHRDAGMVNAFEVTTDGFSPLRAVTQDSPSVQGAAETGDRFGTSVQGVYLENVCGQNHVAIGVPGEDLGPIVDAGAVTVFASSQPSCSIMMTQGANAAAGNRAGQTLGRGHLRLRDDYSPGRMDSLAWAAPGQDLGSRPNAGVVQVAWGDGYDPRAIEMSTGGQAGEEYGTVLARIALNTLVD